MRIIAISGDGIGAGKSTLAKTLTADVFSLAANMRKELKEKYPEYDWFNKSQDYKENTRVKELGNRTVREVLVWYGQDRCSTIDPAYWVYRLGVQLAKVAEYGACHLAAIDDVRKTVELHVLRIMFPGAVTHIHISYAGAKAEPQYENTELAAIADYTIVRPVVDLTGSLGEGQNILENSKNSYWSQYGTDQLVQIDRDNDFNHASNFLSTGVSKL